MTVVVQEDDAGTKMATRRSLEKTRKEFKDGKAIAKELNQVLRKIKNDAVIRCPKKSGTLSSTVRISDIAPTGALGVIGVRINDIFNKFVIAGDITKTNPQTNRPCDYANLVHDGHRLRDGSWWGGVPFLTEAIAANQLELDKAIDRALKKIGKKFERNN